MKYARNLFVVVLLALSLVVFTGAAAYADPEIPPEGTDVSAKNISPGIWRVTISGPIRVVGFEKYMYAKKDPVPPAEYYDFEIRKGRRFNFEFVEGGGKYYALLTPEMKEYPPDYVGENIGIDCSFIGSDGEPKCCFIIIGDRKPGAAKAPKTAGQ